MVISIDAGEVRIVREEMVDARECAEELGEHSLPIKVI